MIRSTTSLLFVVIAVLVAACGSEGGDPADEVAAAVRDTFETSFTFEASLRGGSGAFGGGDTAGMLAGLSVAGARGDNGGTATISVLGTPLVETTYLDEGPLSVRLRLDQLLAAAGQTPEEVEQQAAATVTALELSTSAEDALQTLFEGAWIEIEGGLDPEVLVDAVPAEGGEPSPTADVASLATAAGGDVEGFFDEYVTIDETGGQGASGTYDVSLEVRALARSLADAAATAEPTTDQEPTPPTEDLENLPQQLPGTITTEDGVITELELEVGDLDTGAASPTDSPSTLTMTLSDHGEGPTITAPEAAAVVTNEAFAEIVQSLSTLTEAMTLPGGGMTPGPEQGTDAPTS